VVTRARAHRRTASNRTRITRLATPLPVRSGQSFTSTITGVVRMRKPILALFTVLATVPLVGVLSAIVPRPMDDATIIAEFEFANKADIETGNLASERARSKEVRDFGGMLVQVHTGVANQTRDLARKLNLTPVPSKESRAAKDHATAIAKLRSASPAEFDRAFLEHERAYHATAVSAMNGMLMQAKNEELKKFVSGLVPAFEGHKQAADSLLRKLPATP
jgi:putative membrane protein